MIRVFRAQVWQVHHDPLDDHLVLSALEPKKYLRLSLIDCLFALGQNPEYRQWVMSRCFNLDCTKVEQFQRAHWEAARYFRLPLLSLPNSQACLSNPESKCLALKLLLPVLPHEFLFLMTFQFFQSSLSQELETGNQLPS